MNKKLEKLVQLKKKELDMIYYDKYSPLLHDAYHFLSRKKALLYGGTALNELLPTTLKFYDPYALPDIDVLSPYAKKLATDMVRYYKRNGHQAVSFTEALHEGTYKVFADGIQIADITQCSPKTYEILLQECVRSQKWKIKIVPPLYLRMTLHKIFSQPNDIHRWENVYDRLQRYYQIFPLQSSCSLKQKESPSFKEDDNILQEIMDVMPKETIYFGKAETELLLNKKLDNFQLPPLQMLTDQDLFEIVFRLKQKIPQLTTSRIYPKDDFILSHVFLFYNNVPVGAIYKLGSCVAFNQYKNKRIASIHTMLDLFLSMSLSGYFKENKQFLQCLSDMLSHVQQTSIHSKKKYLEQMVISCLGPSMGLATMKRERIRRLFKRTTKLRKNPTV